MHLRVEFTNGITATTGNGGFSVPNLLIVEGANIITARAVDPVGNVSTVSVSVFLDTTPPAAPLITYPGNGTAQNTTSVSLVGSAEAQSVVKLYDGAVLLGGVTADATGAWSYTVSSLAEGGHGFTATATDAAGNVSAASATVAVVIDTTPPALSIASPADGYRTNQTTITVSGTVDDPTATVTVNGIAATAGNGVFTASGITLIERANTITIQAADSVGNITSRAISVTLDTIPPLVAITSPADDYKTNASTIAVAGTIDDPTVTVTVNSISATINNGGFTASGITLAEGVNSITVQAADAFGNVSTASISVTRDSTPPVLTITWPTDGFKTNASTATVTGTVDDPTATVNVNGISTTVSGGSFTVSGITLAEGANTITAQATDPLGNVSTVAITVTYAKAPVLAFTSPQNLITVGVSPIDVSGTIDDPTAIVTVNGIPATVSGNTFSVANITLIEGMNTIVARAINRANSETTASLSISLDSTPPHVAITSPPDGYKSAASSITVTGILNDIVRGTVNEAQGNVLVNGRQAQISNRNFIVENVPLDRGENTITAVGADAWGNIASTSIKVTYDNTPRNTISIVSGNNQTGPVGAPLAAPLVVEVKDDKGRPIENMLAIFRIQENNGNLFAAGYDGRATSAWTDANGRAQATLTLGTWAGAGNNRVRVTSAGVDGEVLFTATGTTKPPASIYVGQGNQQRGAINGLLPEPIVAYVTDEGHNPLGNVPIIFRATAGGGSFPNGQDSITINSDSDGRATTAFILGPIPGNDGNIVEANFEGNSKQPAGFTATGLVTGDPGNTKITGVVLNNSNQPIQGVTMRVEGTTREAVTDSQGQFSIANVPVGPLHLIADGTTAGQLGTIEYPVLKYALTTIAGANNTVGMPIYLVPLDLKNAKTVGREDVTYTIPSIPGFELTIKKNSVTFPDGSKEGKISVTQVHGDKVPMVPQIGQQPNLIVTIQPPGAVFDPPAPITIPNIDGLKPGEKTNMYSFDHDLGIFVSIGTGTVSEDGMVIKSDPGVGVVKAGWHCGGNPAPAGSANNCPDCYRCNNTTCVPITLGSNQCCNPKTGNIVQKWPIANLSECPSRVPKPGHVPGFNGCGGEDWTSAVPDNPMYVIHIADPVYLVQHGASDGNFTPSCNGHDTCYDTCNSVKNSCDSNFADSMDAVCYRDYSGLLDGVYLIECLGFSSLYESAVAEWASGNYNDAQRKACQCCP